jgi:hypothetical protein
LHKRTWRFVFFTLAILAGFAAGLGYGWGINPVQYHSTGPQALQIDFRTDYVLMAAELYQAEGDLAIALARLDFLGNTSPLALMNDSIGYADAQRYAPADLDLMRSLAFAVQGALDGLE